MKKIILFIVLSLVLSLTSCFSNLSFGEKNLTKTDSTTSDPFNSNAAPKYQIFAHSYSHMRQKPFYGLEDDEIISRELMFEASREVAEKTIDFYYEGQNFCLSYDTTEKSFLYRQSVDMYKGGNDNYFFIVGVDDVTKEIVSVRYDIKDYALIKEKSGAKKLTEEECINIANEFVNGKVENFSRYKLVDKACIDVKDHVNYLLDYRGVISGVTTGEFIRVSVTEYGDIRFYKALGLDTMKDDVLPENTNTLDQKLYEFIDSIYEGYVYDYQSEIISKRFVKFNSGEYAILYTVSVTRREIETDNPYRTSSNYIVYV